MRRSLLRPILLAPLTGALLATPVVPLGPAHAEAADCGITGTTFIDGNRNGVRDTGEAVRGGDTLYLFDGGGTVLAGVVAAADGSYAFPGLACGTYSVRYGSQSWGPLRADYVPTTTGSLLPRRDLTISGAATVDFGWRPIVRSATAGAPLNTYTGPQGLRAESYNDVVPAREVYDAVVRQTLGAEASSVIVRLDISATSMTNSSIGATNGHYDSFQATVNVDWLSWLTQGENTVGHEYGHAWTTFRTYVYQQDPTGQAYLTARGLAGDSRVGSTYGWYVAELMAEDYRQLLGSPTAAAYPQTNSQIPPAASVPGLKDWLLGAFSSSPTSPSPSPSPTATASPSPSPTATASPTPSPSPTSTTTTTTKGGARKRK